MQADLSGFERGSPCPFPTSVTVTPQVVCKEMREGGCCMANVGITGSRGVRVTLPKWTREFVDNDCLVCYEIAEGFRFMPLSLVMLRTFRLSTGVSWVQP